MTSVHTIQGAGHISPLEGQPVRNVQGIVTAVKQDGFYLQEPHPDQQIATSEGVFVYTREQPDITVGDAVAVSGKVEEYYPGGMPSGNLSITEITDPKIVLSSSGNPLPAPILIGQGGRLPPGERLKDDTIHFSPDTEGLDFYESLEGMLVQINDAVVCGPTNAYGETAVLADQGRDAGVRTLRGGVVLQKGDFNPERMILAGSLQTMPELNVGDSFQGAIMGVMDYSFGNYKVLVLSQPTIMRGNLQPETTSETGQNEYSIATMNLENLDPGDGIERFAGFADVIVNHLRSPDILALNEVQDNNGPIDDEVTDASQTYEQIIQTILAVGGPPYSYREIPPQRNQDGGEIGGNIRTGFLFRSDGGISFTDRNSLDGSEKARIEKSQQGPLLSPNPARIDPGNPAFKDSRKPLVGQFQIKGSSLFVIAVHLNSREGDTPLFGRYQPPLFVSEAQRLQQVKVIRKFIDSLLEIEPTAQILVLGDFNDFQFSSSISTLSGDDLQDLVFTLPPGEQYSYIYDGNAQVLDQMIASPALVKRLRFYDIVHVNAEFATSQRLSDHDPVLACFTSSNP